MTTLRRRQSLLLVALLSCTSLPHTAAFSSPTGRTSLASSRTLHTATTHDGSSASSQHYRSSRTSRISLHDALREGSSSKRRQRSNNSNDNNSNSRGARWHQRIFSKFRRNSRSNSKASTQLNMMDEETEALLDSIAVYADNQDFILQQFEVMYPEDVLADVKQEATITEDVNSGASTTTAVSTTTTKTEGSGIVIDEEFFDVAITTTTTSTESLVQEQATAPSSSRRNKNLSLPRLMGSLVENILTSRIMKHARELPEDLTIQVNPLQKTLSRLLLRGQLQADVEISTGRLVFGPIRFSKGRVELEKVTLNLFGFLQQDKEETQASSSSKQQQSSSSDRDRGIVRYPKQFDVHIEDLTMSRNDLLLSRCIRNGLRRLLINILQDRGVRSSSICITSIDILPSGKISCAGEARTHFGSAPIPFEVRSGVSFANRGHVLTFPGLEISLNRDIGLFVPVVPTIDLDVGHNARFHRINIDGKEKQIQLDASVTITPDRTIQLMKQYVQSSEAFSSRFAIDVGRWLTQLLRFSK